MRQFEPLSEEEIQRGKAWETEAWGRYECYGLGK